MDRTSRMFKKCRLPFFWESTQTVAVKLESDNKRGLIFITYDACALQTRELEENDAASKYKKYRALAQRCREISWIESNNVDKLPALSKYNSSSMAN